MGLFDTTDQSQPQGPSISDLLSSLTSGGPSPTAAYSGLTADQQKAIALQQGLTAAGAMFNASGVSRTPVTIGQVLAAGNSAGTQARDSAAKTALGTQLAGTELQQRQLSNAEALWRMQMQRWIIGGRQGPPPQPPAPTANGAPAPAAGPGLLSSQASPQSMLPPSTPPGAGSASKTVADNTSSQPAPTQGQPAATTAAPVTNDVVDQAFQADMLFPGSGKEIMAKQYPGPSPTQQLLNEAAKYPQGSAQREILVRNAYKNAGLEPTVVRQGSDYYDPVTGKDMFQNVNKPTGAIQNPDGSISMAPGAEATISASESAKANAEQAARVGAEKNIKGFEYKLETGQDAPAAATAAGTAPGPVPQVGNFNPGGATLPSGRTVGQVAPGLLSSETPQNPVRPPVSMPPPGPSIAPVTPPPAPAPSAQPQAAPPPTSGTLSKQPDGSYAVSPAVPGQTVPLKSPQGSMVPPSSQQAPLTSAGSAYLKPRLAQWAETENKWGESLASSQIAEQRALAIASALKQTQSGAWATEKADVAASLKAVGINLPASVLGDPAQVQIALKDNFASVLEQIKSFSSRPAAAEVVLGQKNYSNPNLQPESNLAIIAQTVGTLQYDRQLKSDWAIAKQNGWRDPQDFEMKWQAMNPLQPFIDKATAQIGPLKGMTTPTAAPVAPAPLAGVKGLQHSPSTGLFRDPGTGKVYNPDGSPR